MNGQIYELQKFSIADKRIENESMSFSHFFQLHRIFIDSETSPPIYLVAKSESEMKLFSNRKEAAVR